MKHPAYAVRIAKGHYAVMRKQNDGHEQIGIAVRKPSLEWAAFEGRSGFARVFSTLRDAVAAVDAAVPRETGE